MPACQSAGLVLIQTHVSSPSQCATGSLRRMPESSTGIFQSVGKVVAGFFTVQVPAVDGLVDFAGLTPTGWPHPLSAEQVAARTLASLGHRYLPPGPLQQFITAPLHSTPVCRRPPTGLGLRGPPTLGCRTSPLGLRRPPRKARRNVQDVPHPQGLQSLAE